MTGRFTTEDRAQFGYNWYIYCLNNPIRFWDKSGKVPSTIPYNGGYRYYNLAGNQEAIFLGVESIPVTIFTPVVGPAVSITHQASDFFAGIVPMEETTSDQVMGYISSLDGIVDSAAMSGLIDSKYLSGVPRQTLGGLGTSISVLTVLDYFAKKHDSALNQIVGKAFSSELISDSREMVTNKFLYAKYSLIDLYRNGELAYTVNFWGELKSYDLDREFRSAIADNIRSFDSLSQ